MPTATSTTSRRACAQSLDGIGLRTSQSTREILPDIDWVAQVAGGPEAGPRRAFPGAWLA